MAEPKFEPQYSSDEIICPYCQSADEDAAAEISDDTTEYQCRECNKKFELEFEYTRSYNTSPNCKLNGEEHEWGTDETFGTNHSTDGWLRHECMICGFYEIWDSRENKEHD